MFRIAHICFVALLTVGLLNSVAWAQDGDVAGNNASTVEPSTDLSAKVIEVTGDVKSAPAGTSPVDGDAWKAIQVDDLLPVGTMIRTGIRSHLIMMFGDTTVINIKRVTLASIDQFYQTQTQQTVRLGLGYGAVRGGSAEGRLRSDVIVDSTVATLAKRGTEGFEMEVEPYTGRFTISLARHGLVEALEKLTNDRRLVRPGQYANQLNIAKMWIKQGQFDRQVKLYASQSLTTSDLDFSTNNTRGFSSIVPGSGNQSLGSAGRDQSESEAGGASMVPVPLAARVPDMVVIDRRPIRRPDGNFGVSDTFRILVPTAKRSFARRARPIFLSRTRPSSRTSASRFSGRFGG